MCDEDTPEGLQRTFFHIVSYELAWRGVEGFSSRIFREKIDTLGNLTGRIEYNPIFPKITEGGCKKLSDSKWLIKNKENNEIYPLI